MLLKSIVLLFTLTTLIHAKDNNEFNHYDGQELGHESSYKMVHYNKGSIDIGPPKEDVKENSNLIFNNCSNNTCSINKKSYEDSSFHSSNVPSDQLSESEIEEFRDKVATNINRNWRRRTTIKKAKTKLPKLSVNSTITNKIQPRNRFNSILINENTLVTEFFEKHMNPQVIIVNECDGITQTIMNLWTVEYLVNNYFNKTNNLNILTGNTYAGISYGNFIAAAIAGTLRYSPNINYFNNLIEDIINNLKSMRNSDENCTKDIENCCFSTCFPLFKLFSSNESSNDILESKFDQCSSEQIQDFIEKYCPESCGSELILYQDPEKNQTKDNKVSKILLKIINEQHELLNGNKKAMYVSNVLNSVSKVADIVPGMSIAKFACDNIPRKAIRLNTTDTNVSFIQEIENLQTNNGLILLILNTDNKDGDFSSTNLKVNTDESKNKLTIKITNEIPLSAYDYSNSMLDNLKNSISEHLEKYSFARVVLDSFYEIMNYKNNNNI